MVVSLISHSAKLGKTKKTTTTTIKKNQKKKKHGKKWDWKRNKKVSKGNSFIFKM